LSHRDQLARLINVADDLSLPFCKLEVQYLLSSGSESSADQESKEKLASALFDAVTRAVDNNHMVWLELIQGLESDMLLKVSELADLTYSQTADHL
jgi:mediator of RNA polymerase II transcription subunit 12